jgi:hypothetical protein
MLRIRVAAVLVVAVAAVAALGAGTVLATTAQSASVRCGELPAQLRSLCDGAGVTCVTNEDAHARWEAVFATEPTMAHAEAKARLASVRGFGAMHIEKDVQCSNGFGVYEVSQARFTSRAAALELVRKAIAAGFTNARTEDS